MMRHVVRDAYPIIETNSGPSTIALPGRDYSIAARTLSSGRVAKVVA